MRFSRFRGIVRICMGNQIGHCGPYQLAGFYSSTESSKVWGYSGPHSSLSSILVPLTPPSTHCTADDSWLTARAGISPSEPIQSLHRV